MSKYIRVNLSDIPFNDLHVGQKVQSLATGRKGMIINLDFTKHRKSFLATDHKKWIEVEFEGKEDRPSLFPHRDDDYAEDEQPWKNVVIIEEISDTQPSPLLTQDDIDKIYKEAKENEQSF